MCEACTKDARRVYEAKMARWYARVETVNAYREAKGRESLRFTRPWWGFGRPYGDDVEVCRRVFGDKKGWWEREAYSLPDEVKRALRRSTEGTPHWLQKVRPETLAQVSKRLAKMELREYTEPGLEMWTGPRAAEQYVEYRRAQLGLDLVPQAA